jgi:hypothetical protein
MVNGSSSGIVSLEGSKEFSKEAFSRNSQAINENFIEE